MYFYLFNERKLLFSDIYCFSTFFILHLLDAYLRKIFCKKNQCTQDTIHCRWFSIMLLQYITSKSNENCIFCLHYFCTVVLSTHVVTKIVRHCLSNTNLYLTESKGDLFNPHLHLNHQCYSM